MKTNNLDMTRIAVPYYGTLSSPPSGLARIFFLIDVNLKAKAVASIGLHVWNPKKEPNLSSWLRQQRTDGVICSDNTSPYGVALCAEGIWVQWQQNGEVYDVVERWIQNNATHSKTIVYEGPVDSGMPCTLKPLWQLG
jgi:hypothetical protein